MTDSNPASLKRARKFAHLQLREAQGSWVVSRDLQALHEALPGGDSFQGSLVVPAGVLSHGQQENDVHRLVVLLQQVFQNL